MDNNLQDDAGALSSPANSLALGSSCRKLRICSPAICPHSASKMKGTSCARGARCTAGVRWDDGRRR
eukprot:scaffold376199_cov34-Prasinocladus_malaysianus.AAC.1